MANQNEIRADFDRETIVVYQAYSPEIADAALRAGAFVAPFSTRRMTWIKPSFLWLMHRSNWGLKANQERTLAVRITREGWEKALTMAVPTSFDPSVDRSPDQWRARFLGAMVHLQWDPERTLRGARLPRGSIQVGLGRAVIREYVESWVVEIRDLTPLVRKIHDFLMAGRADRAGALLPPEKTYPVDAGVARRIMAGH